MKELIPIRTTNGRPGVNARDLHEFLEVKRDYSTWIKSRIDQYGFSVGEDFDTFEDLISPKSGSSKARQRVSIGYALSLDMAKELAMVERTPKGREARRYFIAKEKELRQILHGIKPEELRDRSKEIRNQFTSTLREHGYDKRHHFIQTTTQMKRRMGIAAKKDAMEPVELAMVSAAEMLATARILTDDVNGYQEINPVCVDAGSVIAESVPARRMNMIEQAISLEETKYRKRASRAKKTKREERVNVCEKINVSERAKSDEKTIDFERANNIEKTKTRERAIKCEKTKGDERAIM